MPSTLPAPPGSRKYTIEPSRLTGHAAGTASANPVGSVYMCQPAGSITSPPAPGPADDADTDDAEPAVVCVVGRRPAYGLNASTVIAPARRRAITATVPRESRRGTI